VQVRRGLFPALWHLLSKTQKQLSVALTHFRQGLAELVQKPSILSNTLLHSLAKIQNAIEMDNMRGVL